MPAPVSNVRPRPDKVLVDIADYASKSEIGGAEAYDTARLCLMDTLGCGLEALEYPACTKLLGPLVPGTAVAKGARVPGTRFELDPVQVASTAVVSNLLGLSREAIINAVSHAWVDGQALRTYRHAPNTGSRKSWAAGDATSRAVRLALIAKTGEMGYPSVLTAKTWGFYD